MMEDGCGENNGLKDLGRTVQFRTFVGKSGFCCNNIPSSVR